MARSEPPMDGEVQTNGDCAKCGGEGLVLLDGTLCERCHGEVFTTCVDTVQQFAVLHEDAGEVVGLGQAYPQPNGQATLAWLTEVRSVGVYDGLEGVQEMVDGNENLRMAYF